MVDLLYWNLFLTICKFTDMLQLHLCYLSSDEIIEICEAARINEARRSAI